jgi:hypothetical protein
MGFIGTTWTVLWDMMGYNGIYPLVNYHNYGNSPFLMGKST